MADFDALWNFDNPAETEHRFRELLPKAEAAGDPNYYIELITQIARTLGLQRKFAEGHALLDEVEPKVYDASPAAAIRFMLERGRLFRSAGETKQAIPLFYEAWEIGRVSGEDHYAVDAAHMLGITMPTAEEKLNWNLTALAVAEQSEKAKRWLGSLYNNIGWTYADMGEYAKALELFDRGVAFRREQGQAGPLRVARWCVAKMLRLLGRPEEALSIQQELHVEWAADGGEDGYVSEELGECFWALGQPDEAKPHFRRAYQLLSQDAWLMEHEPARMSRLKELGE